MRLRLILALIGAIGLSGCGTAAKPVPTKLPIIAPLAIPTDCKQTSILPAMQKIAAGSKYILTKWQPAPGTELAEVLNNGGLACSYGLQSAEVGTTVKWVSNSKGLFEKRVAGWVNEGFTKVDIPGLNDSEAYFQLKKQSATQEFHAWILNVKYRGTWIQVSCTAFAQDLESGLPILKAAVA
jgi:hypothetical protein